MKITIQIDPETKLISGITIPKEYELKPSDTGLSHIIERETETVIAKMDAKTFTLSLLDEDT